MAPTFTIMLIFAVIYPVVGQNGMGLHILRVLAGTMEIEFSAAMGAHSRTMAAATSAWLFGWGGTYGSLYSAVNNLINKGKKIGLCHFNYINPLPKNTAKIFDQYKNIIVCELNSGQFANYLRMNFQGKIFKQYNKIQGFPFTTIELESHFEKILFEL